MIPFSSIFGAGPFPTILFGARLSKSFRQVGGWFAVCLVGSLCSASCCVRRCIGRRSRSEFRTFGRVLSGVCRAQVVADAGKIGGFFFPPLVPRRHHRERVGSRFVRSSRFGGGVVSVRCLFPRVSSVRRLGAVSAARCAAVARRLSADTTNRDRSRRAFPFPLFSIGDLFFLLLDK